jgi:hypothetical protein
MRAFLFAFVALAGAPALAAADPEAAPAPSPHASGAWVELGLDTNLAVSGGGVAVDIPSQHLVIGGQGGNLALGIELGFTHLPSAASQLTVGPALRLGLVARGATELVLDGAVLATIGLASGSMTDGGPTFYTFEAGLELRHWIDPHFAVGGGVLGQVVTASQDQESELQLQLAGTLRVTGVF